MFACRVANFDPKQESVELRFRQSIDALLFDRILSGHDHERPGQPQSVSFNRDLLFLHGFQQGGLSSGGSAVQFVRKQQLAEDWPFAEHELARLTIEDLRPDDVGREQVRCELNSLIVDAQHL